jgi:hypothetical protein
VLSVEGEFFVFSFSLSEKFSLSRRGKIEGIVIKSGPDINSV